MSHQSGRGTVRDAARMLVVPDVFRRPELYPGEDLLNLGKSEIMLEILPAILKRLSFDWGLIHHEFCFPGLGLASPGYSAFLRFFLAARWPGICAGAAAPNTRPGALPNHGKSDRDLGRSVTGRRCEPSPCQFFFFLGLEEFFVLGAGCVQGKGSPDALSGGFSLFSGFFRIAE